MRTASSSSSTTPICSRNDGWQPTPIRSSVGSSPPACCSISPRHQASYGDRLHSSASTRGISSPNSGTKRKGSTAWWLPGWSPTPANPAYSGNRKEEATSGRRPAMDACMAADRAYGQARRISVEVMEALLARVERLSPQLNPFITVVADQALAQARRAEQAILGGEPLGPLTVFLSPSKMCSGPGASGQPTGRSSSRISCRPKMPYLWLGCGQPARSSSPKAIRLSSAATRAR